ncbi:MAG: VWA domain-containing protein [Kofleriaceae bacterium]
MDCPFVCHRLARLVPLAVLLALAACGSHGSSANDPCEQVPTPSTCKITCDPGAPNTCPDGLYCDPDGRCFAQCVPGTECSPGYTCSDDGRCEFDPGPVVDAPPCPTVNFTARPVTPSILLLLDRSDSMLGDFGGISRWEAIRRALVAPMTGVVSQLEDKAYFGAMIYYTVHEPNPVCPLLTTRPRALNNASVIREVLQTEPTYSWTPTAKSIEAAVASFTAAPPPDGSPPFIVLATDGFPTTCDELSAEEKAHSVAAAAASYAAGIPVIPLSVSEDIDSEHVQDLANAGAGVATGQPNAPLYRGNNPAELKAAFDTIIRGVVSCDVTVNGSVTQEQAAETEVRLNGRVITFGTDWVLVGDRTLRLLGAACDEFKSAPSPMVNGVFPCGVVVD